MPTETGDFERKWMKEIEDYKPSKGRGDIKRQVAQAKRVIKSFQAMKRQLMKYNPRQGNLYQKILEMQELERIKWENEEEEQKLKRRVVVKWNQKWSIVQAFE